MWSEKTKNGKVKFVERYKDPLTLNQKKISIVMEKDTPSTRKLAYEELQRKIGEACNQKSMENVTLQMLFDAYMVRQKDTVKPSTYMRNKATLTRLLRFFGSESIVNNLTSQYIKDTLIKQGFEAGTMNEYIARFKCMINWGYENDYHDNIALMRKLKPFKDTPHRVKIQDKYLEEDELSKVLDYMENSRLNWYFLTKFLTLSGLRIGEAAALEISDIDNEYIHITKNYDYVNDIVTTPKTDMSIRDVYIQPELRTMINQYKIWRKEQLRNSRICTKLFFFSKDGTHISYYAYDKYLKETTQKLLGRKLTPHALRHTHASLLMAAGVDVETISRRLGHENSHITRQIYLHVIEKLRERDNEQIRSTRLL